MLILLYDAISTHHQTGNSHVTFVCEVSYHCVMLFCSKMKANCRNLSKNFLWWSTLRIWCWNPGGRNWLLSDNAFIKHRWMTGPPLFNCFPLNQIRFREQCLSQRTNQKFRLGKSVNQFWLGLVANIPKPKESKGEIKSKFHVRNHEVCYRNANLATAFSVSAFNCAWNASVICSRNLIVFVLFIWFSQVFAYGPVTVFSNAWLSSKRLSDFWKGKIHTDLRSPGMAHTTKQGS